MDDPSGPDCPVHSSPTQARAQRQHERRKVEVLGRVPRRVDMRKSAEFATTFKALFNKEQFSDITFVFPSSSSSSSSAPSAKLYAYKGIMCVWSDYFQHMLQGGFKEESQREVVLKDVDFDAFAKVVQFMYTGLVDLTEDSVWSVLNLADMYHVKLLKEACFKYVAWIMGDDNAIRVLFFAEQRSCTQLIEEAVTYIAQRFEAVSSSKAFAGISKEALSSVLSSSLLQVSDPWIVLAALWAWTEDQAGVPHVPLEAPPTLLARMLTDDDLSRKDREKGKDIDRGGNDRSKEDSETQGMGVSKQEEQEDDDQSTIEAKQKIQRDLLVEMLPLLRLWTMPGAMLQHIEKLPALASVPEMKEQLLIAWKCKAGYAPPISPSFCDPTGQASRIAKRRRTVNDRKESDMQL